MRPLRCWCAAGGSDCLADRFEFHTMCVGGKTWEEQREKCVVSDGAFVYLVYATIYFLSHVVKKT